MIRVDRHPAGLRLYIGGRRLHHGTSGAILLAAGLLARHTRSGAIAAAIGSAAIAHDARDFPWRDIDNHGEGR